MSDNLELDLATIISRLEQIKREGYENGHWLLDRVITCDLPRLRQYVTNPEFTAYFSGE